MFETPTTQTTRDAMAAGRKARAEAFMTAWTWLTQPWGLFAHRTPHGTQQTCA